MNKLNGHPVLCLCGEMDRDTSKLIVIVRALGYCGTVVPSLRKKYIGEEMEISKIHAMTTPDTTNRNYEAGFSVTNKPLNKLSSDSK